MAEDNEWAYDRFSRPACDWTEREKEAERLNSEAYLALGQVRADIIGPIVQLLRSSVPIDAVVRTALADAFEAKERYGVPIAFKVIGQDSGALGGKAQKQRRFQRDLAIGKFIERERQSGLTREVALEKAADHFRIGEDSCRRAIGVHAKYLKWRGPGKLPDPLSSINPPELRETMIESIYFHQMVWRGPKFG